MEKPTHRHQNIQKPTFILNNISAKIKKKSYGNLKETEKENNIFTKIK